MSEMWTEQEDREAAAAYEIGRAPESGHTRVLAQAFARHHQAARKRALGEAAEVAFKYPFTDHEHSNPAVCWNAAQEIASQIRKLKEG